MDKKICIAAFIVENEVNVPSWTRFPNSDKELFVPTFEFKGTADEIEDQLNELTSSIMNTINKDY